jgi:hypothetical protein
MFNDMCFFIVTVRASCVNHNVTFTYILFNYIRAYIQTTITTPRVLGMHVSAPFRHPLGMHASRLYHRV